jgi:redox-sensitive bicupin YhaK (pirin superfamily)
MITLIKKNEQYNGKMFNNNMIVNKPVMPNFTDKIQPYSNIFYWSHSHALNDFTVELHPHQGFEIMTFVFEGGFEHFDTASQKWTPLAVGGFQVIQSGSGVEHAEKVLKNSRAFQIWFDPNFKQAIKIPAAYMDYNPNDLEKNYKDDLETTFYINGNSQSRSITKDLGVKRSIFLEHKTYTITLDQKKIYSYYLLKGKARINNLDIQENDMLKVSDLESLDIFTDENSEFFIIEMLKEPLYKAIWQK